MYDTVADLLEGRHVARSSILVLRGGFRVYGP